jgi:hypothetical protein
VGRDILFKGIGSREEPAIASGLGAACANWFLTKGDSDNY